MFFGYKKAPLYRNDTETIKTYRGTTLLYPTLPERIFGAGLARMAAADAPARLAKCISAPDSPLPRTLRQLSLRFCDAYSSSVYAEKIFGLSYHMPAELVKSFLQISVKFQFLIPDSASAHLLCDGCWG